MALPYFYETGITTSGTAFTLSEETSKHCVQVLRMKEGEQLNLTDGSGSMYKVSILAADKKYTEVKIEETAFHTPVERKVCVAISLLKNTSRFEWFLEKSTEIGISEIIPLICHRTERQHFRHDRMNNILIAAMLQSQQAWLPMLHEPKKFSEILASSHQQKFIAHCEQQQKQAIKDGALTNDILFLIGPEGDFTPEEIGMALQHSFQPVSLGNTRLRTETAGVVASTLLMNL